MSEFKTWTCAGLPCRTAEPESPNSWFSVLRCIYCRMVTPRTSIVETRYGWTVVADSYTVEQKRDKIRRWRLRRDKNRTIRALRRTQGVVLEAGRLCPNRSEFAKIRPRFRGRFLSFAQAREESRSNKSPAIRGQGSLQPPLPSLLHSNIFPAFSPVEISAPCKYSRVRRQTVPPIPIPCNTTVPPAPRLSRPCFPMANDLEWGMSFAFPLNPLETGLVTM